MNYRFLVVRTKPSDFMARGVHTATACIGREIASTECNCFHSASGGIVKPVVNCGVGEGGEEAIEACLVATVVCVVTSLWNADFRYEIWMLSNSEVDDQK